MIYFPNLHSSMDRLKVCICPKNAVNECYLHSSMDRLKAQKLGNISRRFLYLHSSMDRLKEILLSKSDAKMFIFIAMQ